MSFLVENLEVGFFHDGAHTYHSPDLLISFSISMHSKVLGKKECHDFAEGSAFSAQLDVIQVLTL